MNQVLEVHKPIGITPLQRLDELRLEKPELKAEKLSYAGRLDPMAEGVMLVLVGEANKQREKYLALDKEYEFEMVLGISSDSYDLLGIVDQIDSDVQLSVEKLEKVMSKFIGKQALPYPPYSSKTVDGKPLWWWASKNRLDGVELPMNEFEVYEIELLQLGVISAAELLNTTVEKIKLIEGDFRQEEIVERWQKILADTQLSFPLVKSMIKCSSGTYVRSLVAEIGNKLHSGAVTYSIKRTWIGEEHTY